MRLYQIKQASHVCCIFIQVCMHNTPIVTKHSYSTSLLSGLKLKIFMLEKSIKNLLNPIVTYYELITAFLCK